MSIQGNYGYGRQGLPVISGDRTSALSYSRGVGDNDYDNVLFVPSSSVPTSGGTPTASFFTHLAGVPNGGIVHRF